MSNTTRPSGSKNKRKRNDASPDPRLPEVSPLSPDSPRSIVPPKRRRVQPAGGSSSTAAAGAAGAAAADDDEWAAELGRLEEFSNKMDHLLKKTPPHMRWNTDPLWWWEYSHPEGDAVWETEVDKLYEEAYVTAGQGGGVNPILSSIGKGIARMNMKKGMGKKVERGDMMTMKCRCAQRVCVKSCVCKAAGNGCGVECGCEVEWCRNPFTTTKEKETVMERLFGRVEVPFLPVYPKKMFRMISQATVSGKEVPGAKEWFEAWGKGMMGGKPVDDRERVEMRRRLLLAGVSRKDTPQRPEGFSGKLSFCTRSPSWVEFGLDCCLECGDVL
ncbi:hypothetical protein QBC40DRAFT_267181 [Triangularia verruculosa]|uniref:Uncharacterized protein n=1 Tax=Triangularia verruculosa TaxID=2587418 RepID=A0AAN6XEE9_9PEZI|nr:hypothetical protein QBC40DRAFT_267181 [Triangularia verruculosa]